MATDYPIEITDPDGSVRIAGLADFTDPDNQPSGPDVQFPFKPAAGEAVTIVEDATGDDVLDYNDDDQRFNFNAVVRFLQSVSATLGFVAVGPVSIAADGPTDTLGFYGAATAAQPVVPLTTPLPQDIIDALVALGLVSQSD